MNPKFKAWLKGLAVAVVTAIATGLLQLLLNPTEVALWTWVQWKGALILSCVFGLIAMLTYIKQSPMPSSDCGPGPIPDSRVVGSKGGFEGDPGVQAPPKDPPK